MKKALYYAIRVMSLYPYVVAVTSEKNARYGERRWYGRDEKHGNATHGHLNDLRGRFDTPEAAEAMRAKVAELTKAYDDRRKQLHKYGQELLKQEQQGLAALFNGKEPGPMFYVGAVQERWVGAKLTHWAGDGVQGGSPWNAMAKAAAKHINPEAGGVIFALPNAHPKGDAND